ncbi:MAG: 50S ribosomal protein L25 [Verrucomicrobia bacterium]|nr:50S ribosomal protein L25 [Verrucomicrobiota bacterium]NBU10233.1 50S ribosomal protein L25 [Pseudomonadota bacterium]NDA67734.1 50S ribosomal protein L25 [Verrucomicrobiota bacterium]NDD36858.1 50S ribosomal protein L25 [Verrucomicrobiota bacterium]NDE99864.1 50S ribosomal protein L25 [Verrucomicrobiota bacterium]
MKSVAMNAQPRSVARRAAVKALRSTGVIPAVIYGKIAPPQNLELNTREFGDAIAHHASENILMDLTVKGDQRPQRLALVQEIQHHPVSGHILHVDFHEVAADEKVTINVPVESTGEAVGVKTGGGVLEHVMFRLKVRALPKDLPEVIVVDVTALEIGKAIHLGEIVAPPGCEILGHKELTVLAVAAPVTEAQETAAAAAATDAPAQPEMIKEKKEEGKEGAAPAKDGDKKADEKKPAEKKK